MGHLFTGSAFASDPRVTHDSVSVQSLGWIDDQKFAYEVLCQIRNVIPVRRGGLEGAMLDQCEKRLIVLIVERRKAT